MPGPAPRDYSGPEPLSEPEAAALMVLAEQYPGDAAVSLHSQGGEIYWNYRGYEPPESKEWAARLAAASGYRAVELSGSDAAIRTGSFSASGSRASRWSWESVKIRCRWLILKTWRWKPGLFWVLYSQI